MVRWATCQSFGHKGAHYLGPGVSWSQYELSVAPICKQTMMFGYMYDKDAAGSFLFLLSHNALLRNILAQETGPRHDSPMLCAREDPSGRNLGRVDDSIAGASF